MLACRNAAVLRQPGPEIAQREIAARLAHDSLCYLEEHSNSQRMKKHVMQTLAVPNLARINIHEPSGVESLGPSAGLQPHLISPGPVQSFERESSEICALDLARQELARSPYPQLRTLELQLRGNELNLYGEVASFFLKQMAQETIRQSEVDFQIRNHLEVSEHTPAKKAK